MSRADERHDISIEEYLLSIGDDETEKDARTLFALMQNISGQKPILYGIGTIGFGVYNYKYDSGREGESHTLGFYPRKGKTTIYLTDGTKRYAKLLAKLGKHSTTGYCLYIKRLSDVDLNVLKQIIKESYTYVTSKAKDGPLGNILWQTDE